jgi:hypothetical protein
MKLSHRVALVEGDIVVIHLLDVDRLIGSDSTGAGRLAEIRSKGEKIVGFLVEVAGGSMYGSPRFLDDILYGFETIPSVRDAMVKLCADSTASMPESLSDPGSILPVHDLDELDAVLRDQRDGRGPSLATIPVTAVKRLRAQQLP